MRIGMGYDVHKLVEGRKLILGGVEIPYEKGLLGHSDGGCAATCDHGCSAWGRQLWEISGSIFRIRMRRIRGFQVSDCWSMYHDCWKNMDL